MRRMVSRVQECELQREFTSRSCEHAYSWGYARSCSLAFTMARLRALGVIAVLKSYTRPQ